MNTQKVTFRNADMAWDIAALILLPKGFDESKRYPTMISVHPFGSCKEQTSSAVYGKALAELGYVVIAFDASFQGESGGLPRYVEDPSQRVEDISRVIDYAVTLPYVDETRIGGLGICGGGAYGGELQVNELLPPSLEFAKENGLTERDVFEATDYYKTPRGQTEGGATRMLFSHAQKTLSWDAFAFTETLLTQPVMTVIGQKVGAFGAYRDGQEVYGRAVASKDRQLVDLENWSHYELYDHPQAVGMAMEKVAPFLDKHLK
ncbi:TPA: alpha/beta hydrolase [Vibrio parahaemolyticus]